MPQPVRALETEIHTFITVLHAASNRDLLQQIRDERLTLSQLQFLERLRGGRVKPTIAQAGQMMNVERSHATRLVDELARRDLVRRETDDTDSRRKHVVITDQGRQVIIRLHAARLPAINQFAASLTTEQRDRLLAGISPILHPERPEHMRSDRSSVTE